MPPFRVSPALLQTTTKPRSQLATRIASALGKSNPPFPIVASCPSPTCSCRETPSDLDIDHKSSISNNIAPYDGHILVSTGQSDWPSRIEDSPSASSEPWATLTADLKTAFGRKGRFFSATTNTLVTASSLPPTAPDATTILHFPSWREYSIPAPSTKPSTTDPTAESCDEVDAAAVATAAVGTGDSQLDDLLSHLTSPQTQQPEHSNSNSSNNPPLQPPEHQITSSPILHPVILICTHNSRDSRCGILGPLLQAEFNDQLRRPLLPPGRRDDAAANIRVAGISHIGGHKWAGNVIVYLPPDWETEDYHGNDGNDQHRHHHRRLHHQQQQQQQQKAPEDSETSGGKSNLSGHAIWYGRVEPRHVEGILRETVFGGRVIRELCRGVADMQDRGQGRGRGRVVRI